MAVFDCVKGRLYGISPTEATVSLEVLVKKWEEYCNVKGDTPYADEFDIYVNGESAFLITDDQRAIN